MKQQKVLAIMPGLIPSTIIGIIKPLLEISKSDSKYFQVRLNSNVSLDFINKFDVIIFCRNCEYMDLKYLYYAKSKGKKVIYELDDNLFEISFESELGKYHRTPGRLYVVKRFMELSDLVHVYSNPLFETASKYNSNVKKINSYFDFSLIENLEKKQKKDKIKIVYATSRQESDPLVVTFEEALKENLDKYSNILELYVFGEIPKKLIGYMNVKKLPYIKNYNKFVQFFYLQNFDIGLAPLKDDIFHRSKTNNKFREYGACGVAGIYSNVDIYSDCIENLGSGLLVGNTTGEWSNAIEMLVNSPELRQRIAENAKNKVLNDYSFEHALLIWKDSFENINAINSVKANQVFLDNRRALIIVKKDHKNISIRLNACVEALSFMNIKLDVIYKEEFEMNEGIINNYNIAIVFLDKTMDYIPSFSEYKIPIIVDYFEYDESFLNNEKLIFVFREEKGINTNNYVIEDHMVFDQTKKHSIDDLIEFTRGTSISQSIIDGDLEDITCKNIEGWIHQTTNKIKSSESYYYSTDSSVIKWIEIIQSELEKSDFIRPYLLDRVRKKILLFVKKKMAPFERKRELIKNRYYTNKALYNINKKGKYK